MAKSCKDTRGLRNHLIQFCVVFCGVWGIDTGPGGEMPSDEDRSLRIGFAEKHFNFSDDPSL